MRIFFIPGFGEEPWIFDKIHPYIPGDKVFVDHWQVLPSTPEPDLTALAYARRIIDHYGITREDLLVGHSMGGWVALHIKHLLHCSIIQIASWTEGSRVAFPITNPRLVYWCVDKGLYLNSIVRRVLLWSRYRNKPSKEVYKSVFKRLQQGPRECVVNQLRIIFNPLPEPVNEQPDLRIHARADSIIRFPKEPACEVPGDHFTLWTHPEQVYTPIVEFLQKIHTQPQRRLAR